MKKLKYSLTALLLAIVSVKGHAETNSTVDANDTRPPIIRFIDDNLMSKQGAYVERKKKFIGIYVFADWCPASRSFTSNVLDFHKLWGDKVALVTVNAGDNNRWFFNRYHIPWRMIDGPARQDIIDYFGLRNVPKFILLDEQGNRLTGEQFKKAIKWTDTNK